MRTRRDADSVGTLPQPLGGSDRLLDRRGDAEYSGMRSDPHESREDQIGHAESRLARQRVFKPRSIAAMVWRVLAVRVNEHVDVGEDQRGFSVRSQSAAESSRSTPGRSPLPLNVNMRNGLARFGLPELARN